MIVFIIIHFISSTLYATESFVKEQQHVHIHHHTHDNLSHKHKHVHAKVNSVSSVDFFINLNKVEFAFASLKEKYIEEISITLNPLQHAIFRPPIT